MDIPSSVTDKFRPTAVSKIEPRSEWEEQLDNFLKQLNPGRIEKGIQPYTHARLAGILKKAGISDPPAAYLLYQRCNSFDSFGKGFTFFTKP